VVDVLYFYAWNIRCFVHAPQNTSAATRTCGMWGRQFDVTGRVSRGSGTTSAAKWPSFAAGNTNPSTGPYPISLEKYPPLPNMAPCPR
jgi:hypothetical protein